MTEEQINHLQSLLDAGTPGEWICERGRLDDFPVVRDTDRKAVAFMVSGGCMFSHDMIMANSDLIADLHNIAPALLEAARENLRLREALEKIAGMNETGGVLNVSMTMLATETIAKAALGKETV